MNNQNSVLKGLLFSFSLILLLSSCPAGVTDPVSTTGFLLVSNDSFEFEEGDTEAIGTIELLSTPIFDNETESRSIQLPHKHPGYPQQHADRIEVASRMINDKLEASRSPLTARGLTPSDLTHTFLTAEGELEATLAYSLPAGKVLIYTDTESTSIDNWDSVGAFIDSTLYPTITQAFGTPSDIDNNGRIVILYTKMSDETILGYFSPDDLISGAESNEMEMIYINTAGDLPSHDETYRTTAHELQHLINYSTRVIINKKPEMELWLDEGLAESAAHLLFNEAIQYDLGTFNTDYMGLIRNGRSLLIFENKDEDYALSYLFAQYLRAQAETAEIYRNLIDHSDGGMVALLAVMSPYFDTALTDIELLHNFRMAIALQNETGPYGFKAEHANFDLTIRVPEAKARKLNPGGAVYYNQSAITTTQKPEDCGENISYTFYPQP